jgi:hypothetical protein
MGKLQGCDRVLRPWRRNHANLGKHSLQNHGCASLHTTKAQRPPLSFVLLHHNRDYLNYSPPRTQRPSISGESSNSDRMVRVTPIWSHAQTNIFTGQAQILQQAARPQKGSSDVATTIGVLRNHPSILIIATEGETPNNLPMPLLQPRKVRQRLHREEVRRRQPPVQSLRPDLPDQYQLPQRARRRVRRLDRCVRCCREAGGQG